MISCITFDCDNDMLNLGELRCKGKTDLNWNIYGLRSYKELHVDTFTSKVASVEYKAQLPNQQKKKKTFKSSSTHARSDHV